MLTFFLFVCFVFIRLKRQLLPSLLCCCYQNSHNLSALRQEMSTSFLVRMLRSAMDDRLKLEGGLATTGTAAEMTAAQELDLKHLQEFAMRFPVELWEGAVEYFAEN